MVSFSGNSASAGFDDKRRVLDATDIVRLIGEHIALKQKGREYVGLCPFHDDHTPSMGVVPHKQIYHCFSCGSGGDALSFVMNFHKMSFREALEFLAERAGVKLTPRAPRRAPGADGSGIPGELESDAGPDLSRSVLIRANQTAASFFRTILAHSEHGRTGRELVARRGLTPEVVEQFELGASPDMWDGLLRTIQSKSLDPAVFRAAGLLKPRDSGGLYDAFRNRLMFPIHDQIGRIIAFGGRRINDQDDPKYLNSPESPVFDKSSTLYALHQAAQEIRKTRRAIVCEGYMDAIACHQAGVRNVVATLGTAMTAPNARILRRLCDQVILLFDGDEAGLKAAERGVEVFFAEPVDVRIATLSSVTDAKDPDELLKREGGRALLDQAIERAMDPMDLLFAGVQRTVQGQGLSARSRTIDDFVTRLCELGLSRVDKVRQQLIIKRISQMAGIDWETIAGLVNNRRRLVRPRAPGPPGATAQPAGQPAAPLTAPEHLLGCVLCEPSLMHALTEEQSPLLEPDAYAAGPVREVARAVASLVVDERPPSLQEILSVLDDPESQRTATRLAAEVERITDGDAERLHKHWRDRLRVASLEVAVRGQVQPAASSENPADNPSRDAGWSDLAELGRAIKENRQRMGHDPRAMPRVNV